MAAYLPKTYFIQTCASLGRLEAEGTRRNRKPLSTEIGSSKQNQ